MALALALLGCGHHDDESAAHEGEAHEAEAHEAEAHGGAHDHAAGAEPAPLAPGENAVQAEMRLLTTALATAPRIFAEPDLSPLAHELHTVHAARERTDLAIESGAYHPPAGADHMDRFLELDAAFHADLEDLAQASLANDRPRAGAALGRVVSGCEGCHSVFRRS